MRKINLATLGVLFVGIMMASGVSAFEIGENCVVNGDFEAGELGRKPAEWELTVAG